MANAPGVAADDAAWWIQAFRDLPQSFITALNGLYAHVGTHVGRRQANEAMERARAAIETARSHRLPFEADDDDICQAAEGYARKCFDARGYEADICEIAGLPVEDPGRPRLIDALWWRRQLRRAVGRDIDHVGRTVGVVHKAAQCYAADLTVKRRTAQQRRIARTLKRLDIVCDAPRQIRLPLDEVVAGSTANPIIRRTEMMTRIGGIEDWAAARGWRAIFVTVTCPSAYHARNESGRPYDWNGSTPREAQDYLMSVWTRTRAAWKRRGLAPVGLRVVEPHHDGCPHWHLLMFAPESQLCEIEAIIRRYALAQDPDEPGAQEHRVKCEPIDRRKGRAVGYIAKYVAKCIDGFGLEVDWYGNSGETAARRIVSWAACWGIRQFQFFGAPQVGVWRELRRIDGAPAGPLGDAWRAADMGLWSEYMRLQEVAPVTLAKAWSDKPTKYGEVTGWIVVGVEAEGVRLPTRKVWRIEKRPLMDLGALSLTVRPNIVGLEYSQTTRYSGRGDAPPPRSRDWHTPGRRQPPGCGPPGVINKRKSR